MSATAILALINLILPQIPNMIGDVEAVWNAIFGIRAALQQTAEWTSDAEAAWQSALQADGKSADWQPAPSPS